MMVQILRGTPVWVWGLLAGLVMLGLSQARARTVPAAVATIMPVAMLALSLWGVGSAFGWSVVNLATWFAGVATTVLLASQLAARSAARYDAPTRRFHLPGSWVPMVLILAIFTARYAVNVLLVVQPALREQSLVAAGVAAGYGLVSGVFAARGLALWRLARAN
ncbi:MAG: hypothetical protein HY854_08325 [Burkholderiales bacterium]|nr:hypothetical protein [Burkholderiales bacterium]